MSFFIFSKIFSIMDAKEIEIIDFCIVATKNKKRSRGTKYDHNFRAFISLTSHVRFTLSQLVEGTFGCSNVGVLALKT